MPTINAKLFPIMKIAQDEKTSLEKLTKIFAALEPWQLEKIAATEYISINAQKLLAAHGRQTGIKVYLYRNATVSPEIKKELQKELHLPTKIYVGFVNDTGKNRLKQEVRKV